MKTLLVRSSLVLATAAAFALMNNALAGQPHMDAAIGYLQQAKAQLQEAEHNKGGWRVKAIKDIDQVITDIQNGKAAAD